MIVGIDHVQVAMPKGSEAEARAFYGGLLGMEEVAKPEPLAARGGCWFATADHQIHMGVETDFRPAKKAHVALNTTGLDALRARLEKAGYETYEDIDVDRRKRFFTHDPFGNRIELIQHGDGFAQLRKELTPPPRRYTNPIDTDDTASDTFSIPATVKRYSSLKNFTGQRADERSDVWALGVLLYECLTGRLPFQAPTPTDTILRVLSDEPPPPRKLNPAHAPSSVFAAMSTSPRAAAPAQQRVTGRLNGIKPSTKA